MRIATSPALAKLSAQVKRENINCWVLVGLSALASALCSVLLSYVILMAVVGLGLATEEVAGLSSPEGVLGTGLVMSQLILSGLGSLALPLFVIITSITLYTRRKRMVLSDLLCGSLALALVDEIYGHEIEAQRQRRYRPNMRPVQLGNDLTSRVNHLAYFYPCYLRLSKMPTDLKVPMATQSGFWLMASILCGTMCFTPLGCLFIVPISLRIVLIWPRVVATKQAVLEFLAGKHDAQLEDAPDF